MFFNLFALDCSTGEAGQGDEGFAELSWFDWRRFGSRWSNPVLRSTGRVGERIAVLNWFANVLGSAIDRVWRLRYSGNTPFAINDVAIEAEEAQ